MTYAERLEKTAVLGAAGKMGSGIVLLTALEMADLGLDPANRGRDFVLHAVDISEPALAGLLRYLRDQARKAAEKKAVWLRGAYADRPDLVENAEIVDRYVEDVLAVVRPTTRLEAAFGANVVFEAAVEGKKALEAYDIFAAAGGKNPVVVQGNGAVVKGLGKPDILMAKRIAQE